MVFQLSAAFYGRVFLSEHPTDFVTTPPYPTEEMAYQMVDYLNHLVEEGQIQGVLDYVKNKLTNASVASGCQDDSWVRIKTI